MNNNKLYQNCSNNKFALFNCSTINDKSTIEPDIERLLESKKQFDQKLISMCKQLKMMANELESYMQLNNQLFEDNLQYLIETGNNDNNNNAASVSEDLPSYNQEIQRHSTPTSQQPNSISSNGSIDSIDVQLDQSDLDQESIKSLEPSLTALPLQCNNQSIECLKVDEIDQLPKYQLNQLINYLYETIVNNSAGANQCQSQPTGTKHHSIKDNCLEQFERLYELTANATMVDKPKSALLSPQSDTNDNSSSSSGSSSLDEGNNTSSDNDDTLFGFSPIEYLCELDQTTTTNTNHRMKSFTFDASDIEAAEADDPDENDTGYHDISMTSPSNNNRVSDISINDDDNEQFVWNTNQMYNNHHQHTSQSMVNLINQNGYEGHGREEEVQQKTGYLDHSTKPNKSDSFRSEDSVRSKSSLSLTRSNTSVGSKNLKTVQIRHYDELTGQECYEEITLKPVKRSETIAVSGKDADRYRKNYSTNLNSCSASINNDDSESLSFDKRRNLWERRSLERRFKYSAI